MGRIYKAKFLGFTFFFSVFLLSFFTSCSVLTEYYLINQKEIPLVVELTWTLLDSPYPDTPFLFHTSPIPKKIKDDAYKEMKGTIDVKKTKSQVVFTLPPKTMIYLGHGRNAHTIAEKIIISAEGFSLNISKNHFKQHFKYHDDFFGPIQAVCVVK